MDIISKHQAAYRSTRNWADDRQTDYNGNHPFVNNDVTQFNADYWTRMKMIADSCASRGLE